MSERNFDDVYKCVDCKHYNIDRINEEGLVRCSKHPFWVKEDEKICDSFEAESYFPITNAGVTAQERLYENNSTKEEKPQKKKFFKKFFDNIGFWLLISPLIIGAIIPMASLIIGIFFSFDHIVEFLTKIGCGYWFVGLIIVPLAIIAIIQVVRGAFLLLEVDADIFGLNERKKDWKGSLYCVINLLGYAALYIFLNRI